MGPALPLLQLGATVVALARPGRKQQALIEQAQVAALQAPLAESAGRARLECWWWLAQLLPPLPKSRRILSLLISSKSWVAT